MASIVHSYSLAFKSWAASGSGVDVCIRSPAQRITVDGTAISKNAAPTTVKVTLKKDASTPVLTAIGQATDNSTPVSVEGSLPNANLGAGSHTLTLVPDGNTDVAAGAFFVVTVTELDPTPIIGKHRKAGRASR